ncbi:hypothetical protein D917_09353, partial [Trichinella nativa]
VTEIEFSSSQVKQNMMPSQKAYFLNKPMSVKISTSVTTKLETPPTTLFDHLKTIHHRTHYSDVRIGGISEQIACHLAKYKARKLILSAGHIEL